MLAFGMVCALLERTRSGKGQVVDAAMVDGAAVLATIFYGAAQSGWWSETPGSNMLDSGAHFYDAYETKDGKYVSIGSIEPQFYAELLEKLGLEAESLPAQNDRSRWPELKSRAGRAVPDEDARRVVPDHGGQRRLLRARAHAVGGAAPSAQPRARHLRRDRAASCSRAPRRASAAPTARSRARLRAVGEHTDEALRDWGFSASELAELRDRKAIA